METSKIKKRGYWQIETLVYIWSNSSEIGETKTGRTLKSWEWNSAEDSERTLNESNNSSLIVDYGEIDYTINDETDEYRWLFVTINEHLIGWGEGSPVCDETKLIVMPKIMQTGEQLLRYAAIDCRMKIKIN